MMKLKNCIALLVFLSVAGRLFAQLDAKSIAANCYKGVVKVLLFDSLSEKKQKGSGYIGRGSGFIVSEDGIVFTNRHVVEYCVNGYVDYEFDNQGRLEQDFDPYTPDIVQMSTITKVHRTGFTTPVIQVYYGKGEEDYKLYVAKVLTIGMGSFDGAVLRIVSDMNGKPVNEKFFALPIGDSDKSQQGEDLCVFGYPAQYDGGWDIMLKDMSTLTFGKLSGYDYVFNKDYGYIKTDASINAGNSGGPVFNETNKVIGIATAVGNKTNIGLVGGINGMYYVVAPKASILKQLAASGLTIPNNAGTINTKGGDRSPSLKSPDELNSQLPKNKKGNNNPDDNGNVNTNPDENNNPPKTNNNSKDYYARSIVQFVLEISDEGTIGKAYEVFDIGKDGGYVYVVVDNYPNPLNTPSFSAEIYKKVNGAYKLQDTKAFDIKTTTKTTYFKYTFTSEGNYRVDIYNKDKVFVNSGFCKVNVKDDMGNTENKNENVKDNTNSNTHKERESGKNTGVSSDYYGSSRVTFHNSVNGSTPGPSYGEFTISTEGQHIFVNADNNGKALKTSELIFDVYKKSDSGEWEFVRTDRQDVNASSSSGILKFVIPSEGNYKFAIYTKDNVWINTGYVTISKK